MRLKLCRYTRILEILSLGNYGPIVCRKKLKNANELRYEYLHWYQCGVFAVPQEMRIESILKKHINVVRVHKCGIKTMSYTVKPRYNAGRGRKNFEAKNRVIARSAL